MNIMRFLFSSKNEDESNKNIKLEDKFKVKEETNLSEEIYPITYSINYLKNRTYDLIKEESSTTNEIKKIEESFIGVKNKAKEINISVSSFNEHFNDIKVVSDEFSNRMNNILKCVEESQKKVMNLKDSSKSVEESLKLLKIHLNNLKNHT